jgi:AAA domain
VTDGHPDDELPVAQAGALPAQPTDKAWLVRHLWSHLAVGLISGHPKVGKSWLGLDLAVSVASGTDCLGAFPVEQPGPALVFLAEDPLPRVRERLASLCALRGLDLDRIALHVITAAALRLDDPADRDRLVATVARLRPRLLLLDPLVRLHSGDENDARYIAALLGFLRKLSREHDLAIAVVHHMSKRSRSQLGQALRGSSDLWAWTDSAAYLTRSRDQILLTLEHRSAPAPDPIPLVLDVGPDGATPHLRRATTGEAPPPVDPLDQRVLRLLRAAAGPVSGVALRRQLGVKNVHLGQVLSALAADLVIFRSAAGWQLSTK